MVCGFESHHCALIKFEMNIIKVENVRRINGFVNRLEIISNYRYDGTYSALLILSENDILNDNSLLKLKGYDISALLLPEKYKYTFNDTKVGKMIQPQLIIGYIISYY